ncbi:unnamed protein product [Lymnaea stagnalis]|uniref:DUF4592 domain-containing protein n=1 Tax=Lymnaea stagnalis TaxID=6523 RepID=A0AAV2HVH4_LYMST
MATFKVDSSEPQSVPMDDDDIRGDGKKKKFKPLSAMKKFFRQKKKKDEVVAVKAQSTTAIPVGTDDDDDDDDGGFKSHQKPRTLGPATRSISEDSVFSPEVREPTIRPFPTTALSVESLPASAFQNELLSKLQKRRSQYSDDDHDDGLPRSPVPPITTADVIMGGPLKVTPGTSKKVPNNRDSDQSLISVDSSENEEESLFTNNWKTSVPAKKSSNQRWSTTSDSDMDQLDFGDIQKTEVLNNKTAKDRILVKPKARKTNRQSRKKRDTTSPLTLPSLNEESPTRSRPDDFKNLDADIPDHSASLKSAVLPANPASLPSSTPTSPQIGSDIKPDMKLNLFTVNGSNKGEKLPSLTSPVTTTSGVAMPSISGSKVTTPTSPVSKIAPTQGQKSGVLTNTSQSSHSNNSHGTSSDVIVAEKVEALSSSYKGGDKVPSAVIGQFSQSQKGPSEEKQNTDFKSRMSQFEVTKGQVPAPEVSLQVSDPASIVSLSPKLRRQGRSKTLPGSTDEQVSPGVQRANSHRIQTSSSLDYPSQQPLSVAVNKVTPPQTPVDLAPPASSSIKKLENMKFSSLDSNSSDNPWKDRMRKKKDENEETKLSDLSLTPAKPGQNLNQPKSVFSSSSYSEKKRGSVETISFKNRDTADQALRKGDNTSSDNGMKHPSAEASQARKESIEIDVTELNKSVKNIVSSSQKDSKQSVPLPASHSTARSFSGLPAAGFMPSVYRSVTTSGKDTSSKDTGSKGTSSKDTSSKDTISKDVNAVVSDKEEVTKPSSVFGSKLRGGSVKSSVKPTDVGVGIPTRADSVKMPASVSKSIGYKMSLTSSALPASTPGVNKPKTQELSKPDTPATPTDTPSSTPSSVHLSVHATHSTSSLPPSAHPVTSSLPNANSKSVPGVHPYKQPANIAFTPKPSSIPSTSKPATSPTSPPPSASFGVKPALFGVKNLNADPATNLPSSSPSSATSTTSPSSSVTSSTPVTAVPSGTQSRSRSLSVFTTSSVSQPQSSITTPSISSRSTVDKSSTFKTGKPAEKPVSEDMRQEPGANTPAWRANIGKNNVPKNEVKIEIIENSAPSLSSSQNNSEILRKGSDKVKASQSAKKNDTNSGTNNLSVEKTASNRSSKVMDMVKNFQNLKATS